MPGEEAVGACPFRVYVTVRIVSPIAVLGLLEE
jgi:hypothetical protein